MMNLLRKRLKVSPLKQWQAVTLVTLVALLLCVTIEAEPLSHRVFLGCLGGAVLLSLWLTFIVKGILPTSEAAALPPPRWAIALTFVGGAISWGILAAGSQDWLRYLAIAFLAIIVMTWWFGKRQPR